MERGAMRACPLVAALALVASCLPTARCQQGLTVHAPESVAGAYPAVPFAFAPLVYHVDATLVVASSCPCSWLGAGGAGVGGELIASRAVLLSPGLCDSYCPAADAACAITLQNASAGLFSVGFNQANSTDDSALAESYRAAANVSGCSTLPPVPTVLLAANLSGELCLAATGESEPPPNTTAAAVPALTAVNLTLAWVLVVRDTTDCKKYESVPYVYMATVPIWGGLSAIWCYNTYDLNKDYAHDLHRMLAWVPLLQFVHGLFSLLYYYSCPWETAVSLVAATLWAVLTILKEPVMLLCLLLLAKGWCITRHQLERREACIAGCTLTLLYASVAINLSVRSVLGTLPMILVYVVVLYDLVSSISANMRILKAQLLALHALGVDPRTTPAHKKYQMFARLMVLTLLYAALELVMHAAVYPLSSYWVFVMCHQLVELVLTVGIGYTFRARPLNVMFQQVQQAAVQLAEQMLPRITTVLVKPDELSGPNLIAWRQDLTLQQDGVLAPAQQEGLPPATIVVLNPGDEVCRRPRRRSFGRPRRRIAPARGRRSAPSAQPRSATLAGVRRRCPTCRRSKLARLRVSSPARRATRSAREACSHRLLVRAAPIARGAARPRHPQHNRHAPRCRGSGSARASRHAPPPTPGPARLSSSSWPLPSCWVVQPAKSSNRSEALGPMGLA